MEEAKAEQGLVWATRAFIKPLSAGQLERKKMLKARAKREDNGEEVVGWYVKSESRHFICDEDCKFDYEEDDDGNTRPIIFAEVYRIDPTTLAVETGTLDKNKRMIFGSIEVDGVLSEGGDDVKVTVYAQQSFTGRVEFEKLKGAWWVFNDKKEEATYFFDLTSCEDEFEIIYKDGTAE